MKRFYLLGVVLLTSGLFLSCAATSGNKDLDKAQFALDDCAPDNTGPCDTAAEEALNVLTADSTNVLAALLRSSALATKGGFDMLQLVSELSKTSNDTQKFKSMHDAVLATIQDVTQLRSGILSLLPPILTTAPASGTTYYEDYYFQLGILEAFESFILPTILAQPTATSAVDVSLIAQADYVAVHDDFIDADNSLITSGITDSSVNGWDLVVAVRENYCVLNNITPGFNLAVLQDLTLCQLCIDVTDVSICPKEASAFTAADFQSPLVTACADFDFSACSGAGPTD